VEAENYIGNISLNNHTWSTSSDANASLGKYINTSNSGKQFSPPSSAETTYPIYFSTPGTYYVWLRAYSPNGTSNAISVGLDGTPAVTPLNFPKYKTWLWWNQDSKKKPVTITVSSAGLHTFSVWERKDGTRLDKIVLSTQNTAPTNLGPDQSPSPTPMPTDTPTPTLTSVPTETPTPGLSDTPTPTSDVGASLVKWLETPYPLPKEEYIDDE
jgi:hypothetical protein